MHAEEHDFKSRWKGWKITAEQIERIKANDSEAINAFYFDNYERLSKLAYSYANKKQNLGYGQFLAEDMLQNLYLDLPKLTFTNSNEFVGRLFNSFYWSAYGGEWQLKGTLRVKKEARMFPLFIMDRSGRRSTDSIGDGQDDYRAIDKYISYPSPYSEYLYAKEQRRQEKLEDDLIPFLSQIFNPKQLEAWQNGSNNASIRVTLQKNADRVIEFLEKHGTSKERLKGQVINDEEEKARKKAYRKWQEEHLDELPPYEKEKVKNRITIRKVREKLKKSLAKGS